MSKSTVALWVAVTAIAVGGIAYAVGLAAGRGGQVAVAASVPAALPAQSQSPFMPSEPFQGPQGPNQPFNIVPAPAPFQAPQAPGQPPTLREFIPIPGPGDQTPGQRPGNESGECEPIILFYHNGQLYQLRPGQGPQDGQGRPGAPPEFFHMNPYQGPAIPGLPMPAPRPDRGPGFSPVNPRS
ncbi:MAG: hypothetical protein QN178_15770 [Armatimonadota bacterium]|nr:hypothetical protein [Armatimonadota bacterium]